MSVSVWEGGYSWLCEVTGRHGSNSLPFSGPSVGYWISLLGSLGNGRFGPNPGREVTGGYGRLRSGKMEKPKKRTEMSSVKCRGWSVEWKPEILFHIPNQKSEQSIGVLDIAIYVPLAERHELRFHFQSCATISTDDTYTLYCDEPPFHPTPLPIRIAHRPTSSLSPWRTPAHSLLPPAPCTHPPSLHFPNTPRSFFLHRRPLPLLPCLPCRRHLLSPSGLLCAP